MVIEQFFETRIQFSPFIFSHLAILWDPFTCHLLKFISLNLVPNAHVCVYLMVHITKLQLQTTFPKLFVFLSTSHFTKANSLFATMKMYTASWLSNLRTVATPCAFSRRSTSCPLSM